MNTGVKKDMSFMFLPKCYRLYGKTEKQAFKENVIRKIKKENKNDKKSI